MCISTRSGSGGVTGAGSGGVTGAGSGSAGAGSVLLSVSSAPDSWMNSGGAASSSRDTLSGASVLLSESGTPDTFTTPTGRTTSASLKQRQMVKIEFAFIQTTGGGGGARLTPAEMDNLGQCKS